MRWDEHGAGDHPGAACGMQVLALALITNLAAGMAETKPEPCADAGPGRNARTPTPPARLLLEAMVQAVGDVP